MAAARAHEPQAPGAQAHAREVVRECADVMESAGLHRGVHPRRAGAPGVVDPAADAAHLLEQNGTGSSALTRDFRRSQWAGAKQPQGSSSGPRARDRGVHPRHIGAPVACAAADSARQPKLPGSRGCFLEGTVSSPRLLRRHTFKRAPILGAALPPPAEARSASALAVLPTDVVNAAGWGPVAE